jgi:hypothetical protein
MKNTKETVHKSPAGVSQSREAICYLNNAKAILKSAPIEDNTYTDVKYVQEACGTAYLAIIKAIDEFLLKKGDAQKDLPQSVDGYRDMIRKYLSVHNSKLTREFDKLYKLLHIAGYYRGLLVVSQTPERCLPRHYRRYCDTLPHFVSKPLRPACALTLIVPVL